MNYEFCKISCTSVKTVRYAQHNNSGVAGLFLFNYLGNCEVC